MNFDLDADEIALRDSIRELCRKRASLEDLRQGEGRLNRDLWRALGDAGVFSLRLPEERGGLGLGMTEAVVVFEELGRGLVPGPLVATHLAAGWIDGAATGGAIVGLVEATGEPVVVEHLDDLDDVLVLEGDRVLRAKRDAIEATRAERPLDPLTPVQVVRSWHPAPGADAPADLMLHGAALTAALLAGIAGAVAEAAVAYAKDRKQFGRPIGSFQAVKHLCADAYTKAEVARAAVYAAGCILDDPAAGDPRRAVAAAKLLAAEAAVGNGKTAVQVYGGMGFTWEMDVHLYLKRAAVLATHFGGGDSQAERVAATLRAPTP